MVFLRANIAWSALKADRTDLSARIDDCSRLAVEAAPDSSEVSGTRGAWLAYTGDIEAGVPMLIAALRRTTDQLDRADFCRFLSRAMLKLGDEPRSAAFAALE